MTKIIYVLTALILFVLATLVRKKENKMDFITTFFVEIVVFSCFNIVSCFLLKILNLNTTLLRLTIINIITIIPLIYKIYKDKAIQEYYINKKDILALVIIILFGFTIMYLNYGYPMNIAFLCTDSANHYTMATDFYHTGEIGIGSMPGAYINYGIVFKVLYNEIEMFNGVYIFEILESIKFVLSGILFYLITKRFIKDIMSYIITILLSIIYMAAYPLNDVISGFVYLQMAINIIATIIIVFESFNSKEIDNSVKNLVSFFLVFGLAFTYLLLLPPVLIAVIVYEIWHIKDEKNNNKMEIRKQAIKNILLIIAIPCIIAAIHFLVFPKLGMACEDYEKSGINLEGYIYKDYYSIILFFIPFSVVHIILTIKNSIKSKQSDFTIIMVITTIAYLILAYVLNNYKIVSLYYTMKIYYLLWLLLTSTTAICISEALEANIKNYLKVIICVLLFLYIAGVLIAVFYIGPCSINVFDNKKEDISSMYNIYMLNRGVVTNERFSYILTNEELQLFKKIQDEYVDDDKTCLMFEDIKRMWINGILNKPNLSDPDTCLHHLVDIIKNKKDDLVITIKDEFSDYLYGDLLEMIDSRMNKIDEAGRIKVYTYKEL